jgi:hypothetical protein
MNMEQLGCLLLGFGVVVPVLVLGRTIILTRKSSPLTLVANERPCCQPTPNVPACDSKAVVAYFASLLRTTKPDPAQAVSIPDLISSLEDSSMAGSLPVLRFDGEGGYRLRL